MPRKIGIFAVLSFLATLLVGVAEAADKRRRNKATAGKLMRKLLKKQGFAPSVVVTDKLRSYSSAFRNIGP